MKRNSTKPRGKAQVKKIRTNVDDDPKEAKLSQLLFHKSKNMSEKLKPQNDSYSDLDLKAAWIDEDDQNQVASNPLFKGKSQYADKLKLKFETMMGSPNWAKIKPKTEEDTHNTLNRVGHLESRKKIQAGTGLQSKILDIKPTQHINYSTHNEGRSIQCVEFHPKLSLALVGGTAGIVSLLPVGGKEREKLHSFQLKKWIIHNARFTPDGTHAFITSSSAAKQYCYYDLVKAVPEITDLPDIIKYVKLFELSTDGKYIAMCDGFDEVLILSGTSRELIKRLKNNSDIVSICFSNTSKQLYCYGDQGEVTMWDLSTFRSYRKFYDHGCVKGSIMKTSPCDRLLALGSGEGIVNIYQTSTLKETTTYNPEPFHTVSNLTTKITGLQFNATTEIMAIISNVIPCAAKLVHIPSYKIFQNFPTQGKDIGVFNSVSFTPNSGYMGMGNDYGCALLFRLKHYKNY